jgi:hypothetical protein
MSLDTQTLKSLIERANPKQAAKRFKTGGSCGNEGIFRFSQLLQSNGVEWHEANPYLLAWFSRWEKCLVEVTGAQWDFEDIIVMAGEAWNKVKYKGCDQLGLAIARAHYRLGKKQTIPNLDGYGGESVRLLVLICYELSQIENPFFITERQVAEILGLDREGGRRKAKSTMTVLCNNRILSLFKKGNQVFATRYRFTGYPPKSVPESQKNPENPEEPRRIQKTPKESR